jgi:hypothetical protein
VTGSADGDVRVWVSSFFLSFFCFLFPAFFIEGDKRFRGFIFSFLLVLSHDRGVYIQGALKFILVKHYWSRAATIGLLLSFFFRTTRFISPFKYSAVRVALGHMVRVVSPRHGPLYMSIDIK